MAYCSDCGAPMADGLVSCPRCGRSTTAPRVGGRAEGAGFFQALFDFSFTSFVTTKLIKVLYGLSICAAGLIALILIVVAFQASPAAGVVALLIGGPLYFLFIVTVSRVWLEVLMVIFRISEHTAEIAERGRARTTAPGASG